MQITETLDNIISTNLYLFKPSDAIKKKNIKKKNMFFAKKNLASKKTLKKCFFFF